MDRCTAATKVRSKVRPSACGLRTAVLLVCAVLFMPSCQRHDPQPDRAAIITAAEGTQQALADAANKLMGRAIALRDDALTQTSVVTLEHSRATPNARIATSRMLERPEQLQLVFDGLRCSLVRLKTGERAVLKRVNCTATEEPLREVP